MNNLDENIENKNSEKKEIKIVSGNGKDLNISPVYDHIDIEKPNTEKEKKKIIIPEEKK